MCTWANFVFTKRGRRRANVRRIFRVRRVRLSFRSGIVAAGYKQGEACSKNARQSFVAQTRNLAIKNIGIRYREVSQPLDSAVIKSSRVFLKYFRNGGFGRLIEERKTFVLLVSRFGISY